MPWPRRARMSAVTVLPDAWPWTTRLVTSAAPGGSGVPKPRETYQEASRSPALHETTIESSTATRLVATRRVVGCPGGVIFRTPVGVRDPPPPDAGMQPACGR